jgi:hypothetical protein
LSLDTKGQNEEYEYEILANSSSSHHAEGLVDPKVRAQKRLLFLDTPEHVILKIAN